MRGHLTLNAAPQFHKLFSILLQCNIIRVRGFPGRNRGGVAGLIEGDKDDNAVGCLAVFLLARVAAPDIDGKMHTSGAGVDDLGAYFDQRADEDWLIKADTA